MAEVKEIYRCDICGIVVEVINAGPGTMSCCNQPMTLQENADADA